MCFHDPSKILSEVPWSVTMRTVVAKQDRSEYPAPSLNSTIPSSLSAPQMKFSLWELLRSAQDSVFIFQQPSSGMCSLATSCLIWISPSLFPEKWVVTCFQHDRHDTAASGSYIPDPASVLMIPGQVSWGNNVRNHWICGGKWFI